MNNLSRIDWNLIPALDALLTERSVSRAARRTNTSQPAMSKALQRLRRHFEDELLVRQGNSYRLTPVAAQLAPLTHDLVNSSLDVLAAAALFDPGQSRRHFKIAATGALQASVGPLLLAAIGQAAPHVKVSFIQPFVEPFRTNEDVLAGTDGWIAPTEMLPGHQHTGLIADSWACVVAENHPSVGAALTLADAARLPWVAPTIRGAALSVHVDSLMAHGIEPDVEVETEDFTAVAFLVSGTHRIGVMQRSVADRLAAAAGIRVLECPWAVQPLNVTFWWDAKWTSVPAHVWLRGVVEEIMPAPGTASDQV